MPTDYEAALSVRQANPVKYIVQYQECSTHQCADFKLMSFRIAICIPTYKRSHLLILLLQDILKQNTLPDYLVIVDGDPRSGEVRDTLSKLYTAVPITYVPSNYGNLSYQRYLGWHIAQRLGADVLVYFDDDERILQENVLEMLVAPLGQDGVVGVGCHIRFGEQNIVDAPLEINRQSWRLVSWFGAGKRTLPGDITPIGNRIPLLDDGRHYVEIRWLSGGVMCYRMSAITQETFSANLFALDHIRCGLGEDTFLSRRVGFCGKLLYTFRVEVHHPNLDTTKAYPYQGFKYAYAATYSRRFQNDYYRVYSPPTLSDRLALLWSYAGNLVIAWTRALTKPTRLNWALARGTTAGAFFGLIRPPTAKRLTPNIDWWEDAEEALAQAESIVPAQ